MAIKKDDESATDGRVKNVINFVIKMLLSYIFFDVFSWFIAHVNFARAYFDYVWSDITLIADLSPLPLAPLPNPLARIIRCPFLKGSCEMFADFSHFSITWG